MALYNNFPIIYIAISLKETLWYSQISVIHDCNSSRISKLLELMTYSTKYFYKSNTRQNLDAEIEKKKYIVIYCCNNICFI